LSRIHAIRVDRQKRGATAAKPVKMSKGLVFRHKSLLDAFSVFHNDKLSPQFARKMRPEHDDDVCNDPQLLRRALR